MIPTTRIALRAPIVLHDLEPTAESLLHSVIQGLAREPRSLPCKFLYDEEGARLFERICTLEAYYPTRTETRILQRHAAEIARLVGPDARLVELGSGSAAKTRLLLEHLERPAAYVPIDLSRAQLVETALTLAAEYPGLHVEPVCADYTGDFPLPELAREARRTVAFFPGSTIGNFAPGQAQDFLRRLARLLGPGGGLVVGVDLEKDPRLLERAYDDPEGVTAAFNLNLLRRINRECGADFDLDGFAHRAVYEAGHRRIEMHLVSRRHQTVRIGGAANGWTAEFRFRPGDQITTEHSYKFTMERFRGIAERAGFRPAGVWTDPRRWFSVHYLEVGEPTPG